MARVLAMLPALGAVLSDAQSGDMILSEFDGMDPFSGVAEVADETLSPGYESADSDAGEFNNEQSDSWGFRSLKEQPRAEGSVLDFLASFFFPAEEESTQDVLRPQSAAGRGLQETFWSAPNWDRRISTRSGNDPGTCDSGYMKSRQRYDSSFQVCRRCRHALLDTRSGNCVTSGGTWHSEIQGWPRKRDDDEQQHKYVIHRGNGYNRWPLHHSCSPGHYTKWHSRWRCRASGGCHSCPDGFQKSKVNYSGVAEWGCNVCEWSRSDEFEDQTFALECQSNLTLSGRCYSCPDYSGPRSMISFERVEERNGRAKCRYTRHDG